MVSSPKLIPWFVSDVTPADFSSLVSALSDPAFFPPPPDDADTAARASSTNHLQQMVDRWQRYIADGTFALDVSSDTPLGPPLAVAGSESAVARAGFWSLPWPSWDLRTHSPKLYEEFCQSGLVIFKVSKSSLQLIFD
jgi:damage-control phosphatase, subfamily III